MGGGIRFNPPPTPQQGRARAAAIRSTWAMERLQIRGRWSRAVLPDMALDGRGYFVGPPLPPTGSCTHVTICPHGMALLGVGGGY